MKKIAMCATLFISLLASGYEYDVSQPLIKPRCFGAQPGEWTLDWQAALANAKADGKNTILLMTGGWWCPFCHTLEKTVLVNDQWKSYVEEKGFYLAEMDFSYRYDVPEDQLWKSYHPELGKGWGFKCWYMNPDYLAENGMTLEQGLDLIQTNYVVQGEMAVEGAQDFTMSTWDGKSEFTYKRMAYAVLVVFGPDGEELGRVDFPWHNTADVTITEAQEFEIQAIEQILNGSCTLCKDPVSGVVDTTAAQTYTGWVTSDESGISGYATFKIGKQNKKGKIRISGSTTIAGRKTTFKAVTVTNIEESVSLQKDATVATMLFGSSGMSGTLVYGGTTYSISGARNVFKAKDETAKETASECPSGTWNLVLKTTGTQTETAFAHGYGSLSVSIKAKGKAKVSGTLGDGTKVSVSSQMIAGENGIFCLPVRANLYSKKGGMGFVMWFKNGKFLSVTDVSPWVAAGKNEFEATYDVVTTTSSGMGTVSEEMDLILMNFDIGEDFSGMTVVGDPSMDIITVDRNKWLGTETTKFKATCNAKTGVLKGQFTFFVGDETKPKKVKGKFSGIVMGGSGYGTVLVKDKGTWAVKISACGSCGD